MIYVILFVFIVVPVFCIHKNVTHPEGSANAIHFKRWNDWHRYMRRQAIKEKIDSSLKETKA